MFKLHAFIAENATPAADPMQSDNTRTKKSRQGARGMRKVKTGCLTCKIRHKKCDEKMPSCTPCSSTGRKCDFESLVSQSLKPNNHLGMFALNTGDSVHFDYFVSFCTEEFSLYFESPVWESIILQAACTEPCIRHAALAIGAMSRNNYNRHAESAELEARKFSMQQYNLALRTLNHALDGQQVAGTRSWELALLGSIVFIAFEVLWGLDMKVKMHIDAAFAIVMASTNHFRGRGSGSSADLGYLVSALSQLGAQFSSFGTLHTAYSEVCSAEGGMARNAKL